MRRWLQGVAARFMPEVAEVDEQMQALTWPSILGALYGGGLGVVGLAWLILVTDWRAMAARWTSLLFFFVLRWVLAQFDFSTLFQNDSVRVHGSQGRVVTWSAALLLGPMAVWLEIAGVVVDQLQQRLPPPATPFVRRVQRWDRVRVAGTVVARETLSLLPALWLYARWGGATPLPDLTLAAVTPALLATLAKSGLFVLVMLPVLGLFLLAVRRPSMLELWRTFARFWLAILVFYLIPDPFGVLAAALYAVGGTWAYLFFLAAILVVSFLAHRLSQLALTYQRRVQELQQLETFTQTVLNQSAPEPELRSLLQRHVPDLLPLMWVEIRLFPDVTLYRSDRGSDGQPVAQALRPSVSDMVWERLAISHEPYLLLRTVSREHRDGLLVPILDVAGEDRVGGICVLPHGYGGQAIDYLPATRSLAALIASVLFQQKRFEEALNTQAEAYQEAVYEQALQAEVYAQALAYQQVSRDLAVAGQIQASFLPQHVPDIIGWQLAVALEPARATSGDFYDLIPLPGDRLGLLVADVADKGIGPALFMALTRTLIRTYAAEYVEEPDQVLAHANRRIMAETSSDLFVTVFYAVLAPDSGRLVYCNAGHNPPLWLRAAHQLHDVPLTRTAMPLGILPDTEWARAEVALAADDVLVLYSDGITEAQDEDEQFFGLARLRETVRGNAHRTADAIESKLINAVYDFVGEADQSDDITLMVLKREAAVEARSTRPAESPVPGSSAAGAATASPPESG